MGDKARPPAAPPKAPAALLCLALLDERATLRPNFHMRELGPRPTLGELQRSTPWVWLWCERSQHHAPLACAVALIRRGPNTSSDRLRPGPAAPAAKARRSNGQDGPAIILASPLPDGSVEL